MLCHILSGLALLVALASCTTWLWTGGADYSGDPEARREAAREKDRAGFATLVFGIAAVGLHVAARSLGRTPKEPG